MPQKIRQIYLWTTCESFEKFPVLLVISRKCDIKIEKWACQFVIFKPLSYRFEETIEFDVKASLSSPPVLRLIRWYNKRILGKGYSIKFHGTFHGLKITNCYINPDNTSFPNLFAVTTCHMKMKSYLVNCKQTGIRMWYLTHSNLQCCVIP